LPQGTVGFGVHHEWGTLREAVVGIGAPQADVLAVLLEREGVKVRRSAPLFVRDPLIVVGDQAIDASLRAPARQHERLDIGRDKASAPRGGANGVDGPYIEGGDVLVNGREIYAGMSGRASDMAGIDGLEALVGAHYRVIAMALRSSVLHLQDVLALVRPGLLVMQRDKLIDGLPMSLRSWDAIAASPGLLQLDAGRVVVTADNTDLIAELRARRMDVMPLRFDLPLRAVVQPLWRE
jgi:glycine amidinotransferase